MPSMIVTSWVMALPCREGHMVSSLLIKFFRHFMGLIIVLLLRSTSGTADPTSIFLWKISSLRLPTPFLTCTYWLSLLSFPIWCSTLKLSSESAGGRLTLLPFSPTTGLPFLLRPDDFLFPSLSLDWLNTSFIHCRSGYWSAIVTMQSAQQKSLVHNSFYNIFSQPQQQWTFCHKLCFLFTCF